MNDSISWLHLPWELIVPLILSQGIPYLAALVSKRAGWWQGFVTAALSFVTSFLTVLVNSGEYTGANVRFALFAGFGTWAAARLHYRGLVAGEDVEKNLHAVGNKRPEPAPQV